MLKLHLATLAALFFSIPCLCPHAAQAQGARFEVHDYIEFPYTRIGKTTIGFATFVNLDSSRALHVKLSQLYLPKFVLLSPDSFTVTSGRTDSVFFSFTPTDTIEYHGKAYYVDDGDSTSFHRSGQIELWGSGTLTSDTLARLATVIPSHLTASTDTTVQAVFRIFNITDTLRDITGSLSVVPGHSDFQMVSGDTAFVIHQGDGATFIYRFSPRIPGIRQDTFVIRSNSNTPLLRIPITEEALNPITASISDSIINFGNVDVGKDSSVYVYYSSTTKGTAYLKASYHAPNSPFYISPEIATVDLLIPFDSRTFSIDFRPTAPGKFNDSLVITSNATPSERRLVVYLHGEATVSSVQTLPLESAEIISNPAHDDITLRLFSQEQDHITVELVNELGQSVRRLPNLPVAVGLNTLSIHVSDLPRGQYFLRVSGHSSANFKVALR